MQPLSFVAFTSPVQIEGCSFAMLTVEPKVSRLPNGVEFICPQPFLDSTTRVVVIGSRCYPLERVQYYSVAKMAKSKNPPPADMSVYTIGVKA